MTKEKWLDVVKDIAKYAIGAILGAVGICVTGCACAPTMWFV